MNESWNDLGPLDPERDPARWEGLLRRTRAAAARELSRRAFAAGPAAPLVRWVRPALAMAASLLIAAAGLLAMAGGDPLMAASPAPGVAEAMGVPVAPAAGWVEDGVLGPEAALPDDREVR
jgi:hypothetical protein